MAMFDWFSKKNKEEESQGAKEGKIAPPSPPNKASGPLPPGVKSPMPRPAAAPEPQDDEPKTITLRVPKPGAAVKGKSTQRIVLPGQTQNLAAMKESPAGNISVPIGMIARLLPKEVVDEEAVAAVAGEMMMLPLNLILPQLQSGKIEMTVQEIIGLLPPQLLKSDEEIQPHLKTIVALPMMDIITRIPSELMAPRIDQKTVDPTAMKIQSPFTASGSLSAAAKAVAMAPAASEPSPAAPAPSPAPVAPAPAPAPAAAPAEAPSKAAPAEDDEIKRLLASIESQSGDKPEAAAPAPKTEVKVEAKKPEATSSAAEAKKSGTLPTAVEGKKAAEPPAAEPKKPATPVASGEKSGDLDPALIAALQEAEKVLGDGKEGQAIEPKTPVAESGNVAASKPTPTVTPAAPAPTPAPASEPVKKPEPVEKPKEVVGGIDLGSLKISEEKPAPIKETPKPAPSPAETIAPVSAPEPAPAPSGPEVSESQQAAPAAEAEPLDLNNCDALTLEKSIGCSHAIAESIVKFRQERGGFSALEELLEVPGMTPDVYSHLTGSPYPETTGATSSISALFNEVEGQAMGIPEVVAHVMHWPDVIGCVIAKADGSQASGHLPAGMDVKRAVAGVHAVLNDAVGKAEGVFGERFNELLLPFAGGCYYLQRRGDFILMVLSRTQDIPGRSMEILRQAMVQIAV